MHVHRYVKANINKDMRVCPIGLAPNGLPQWPHPICGPSYVPLSHCHVQFITRSSSSGSICLWFFIMCSSLYVPLNNPLVAAFGIVVYTHHK